MEADSKKPGGLKINGWIFFVVGLIAALIIGWIIFPLVLYSEKSQPLIFSHASHGPESDAGMECEECHFFNDDGTFSGIPGIKKCMECHEDPESLLGESKEEKKLLSEQIKNVTKENKKVKYENKSLIKILTRQKGTLLSQSNALKKYIQKLKIKVLSRDSKNSAEKMAKRLNEIGYNIKSISYAPQSKFSRNTVYFVPEFKDEAEQLVVRPGGNTTFKPLNWPSVFDLIVVTEKNH